MISTERAVAILCLLMIPLGQIGIDIYMPSLPHMANVLHSSNSIMQFSVTVYLFSLGCALFLSGPLSDRFGRYPLIVIGLIIYSSSALATSFAETTTYLLIMRFFQGLGAGTLITNARASVSDVFEGQQLIKIVNNMNIVWACAPILAPFIGGYLHEYFGWQASFFFMALYSAMLVVLVTLYLNETHTPTHRTPITTKQMRINFKRIVSHPKFIAYIALMTATYSYIIFFNVTAPFLLQTQLKMDAAEYGTLILFAGISYLIGSITNRWLIRTIELPVLIAIGIGMCLCASLVQLVISMMGIFCIASVIAPTYFSFAGIGFIYGNCLSSGMALFRDIAGSASSLLGFIPMAGCALATILASKLPETTSLPFAASSFIILLAGLIIYILASRRYSSSY